MSSNGQYVPSGPTNGGDDNEREHKRRKTSPSGGFKQPQLPNPKGPLDDRTDINDLSDLVHSSGIDLREEENYLASSYHHRQAPQARPQQQSNQHLQSTQQQSQPTNYDLLSRTSFPAIGQQNNVQQRPPLFHGKDPAEELESRQKRVARAEAEKQQYQLNDPFFYGFSMRQRTERIANDYGIKLPMHGLYDKIPKPQIDPQPPHQAPSSQPNGNRPGLTINTQHTAPEQTEDDPAGILNRGAPLDPIFSLLSLAGNDRIRSLLEDAFALARGRQITADGDIPPEYQALVIKESTPAGPTQNGVTAPATEQPAQAPPASISAILTAAAHSDRLAEEARVRKRAARTARRAALAAYKDPDSTPLSASDPNTPGGGVLGTATPESLAALPKISKKEMERQKKADLANEAAATRNANSAVAMALGGKASKYSWMNKGPKGSGANTPMKGVGIGKGGGSGTGTPRGDAGGRTGGGAVNGDGPASAAEKKGKDGLPPRSADRVYGGWREDGPGGKDVQLRDWICALEGDGRERKALALAMLKLGREALLDS